MKHSKSPVILIPFAKALKRIAFDLGWDGKKDERGRKLLQLLGTDVCRNCIADDYWIKKWVEQYEDAPTNAHIIADDVRFINEVEAIVLRNGITFKVTGRKYDDVDSGHPSEKGIIGLPVIQNRGSLEALDDKAKVIAKELGL